MRDIDSTVDFVKDLLKNDNSARASPSIDLPGTFSAQRGGKQPAKDASVYKHDDSRATGYKSSARHLDRKQVRYEGEDKDEELGSIRRDLENSSKVLDRTAANFAERTEEDERLEQELDDLKYRVRRVKDDIEYVSRGKRSDDKDEERRKLERELLYLMHERLPEVEKKIEEREERKRQEARDGIRARDKRNETYGRYRDRDYDRERDYERRDRFDDDRYRRGSRDNSRERRGSRGEHDSYSSRRPISPPPRDRTPPATPAAPRDAVHSPPPAPPAPTSARAAVPSTKSMTPEERTAFIRQQAQERLAARMRALGMAAPEDTPSSSVDQSVEDRLAREKKEAEEKARQAEKQQEEREAARKARLQQAGGGAPEPPAAPSSAPTPPAPLKSAMKKAPAPPPPKPRAAPSSSAVPKAAPPAPAPPKEDPADAELRAQEQAHQKAMEERRARLKRMQEEEEEAQRAEEAIMQRRQAQQKAETPVASSTPVMSPPATQTASSTNPFHRLGGGASAAVSSPSPAAPAAANGGGGGFNPFFRPPATQKPVETPKSASPAPVEDEGASPPPPPPPAPAPPAFTPQSSSPAPFSQPQARKAPVHEDEEWDVIDEKDNDSDSSDDDDYAGSRKQREAIARSLFGGAGSRDTSKPASPAPVANKAALSKLGGGNPADRGGLLSAIKMGAGLRKAVTNDRSASSISGKVVGDAAPPPHISLTPQEPVSRSVPAEDDSDRQQKANHRQSVDWYSGLAADAGPQAVAEPSPMPSVAEDEEPPMEQPAQNTSKGADDDELAEFDMATSTSPS